MKNNEILIANNFLPLTAGEAVTATTGQSEAALGTVLANMAYFGFAPSLDALALLRSMSGDALGDWWRETASSFRAVTGADREMERFVVYKNFPREVLEMSASRYWVRQILMYLGAPNEWFTEPEEARPKLDERLKLRVLQPATGGTLRGIFDNLVALKASWTNDQAAHAQHLVGALAVDRLVLSAFGFKVNGISLIAKNLTVAHVITDATDVLRLAAALSTQDVTLRENVKFKRFKRAERRQLLAALETTNNLADDVAQRAELFKKLFAHLHPGDYGFERVKRVYDGLYKGTLLTYSAKVEAALRAKDEAVFDLVATRPGDFARRLHHLHSVFGQKAVEAFAWVTPQLPTLVLLKLRTYVATVDHRQSLMYAPRGDWARAHLAVNEKAPFGEASRAALLAAMDAVLGERLKAAIPEGVDVDARTVDIKLQTNDQELAPYGRGTSFALPPEAKFVRTASYWKVMRHHGNTWFDNGWSFHDESWAPVGVCCWTDVTFGGHGEVGAVFSGDPTNSKEMQGRACQMIDLNLEGLRKRGVRYAVWNVLCYSRIAFSDADDVLATLQWGEDAAAGKLYEPARAQMVFPLKGNSLTKYVAYIDVVERKLVYMDANLQGGVRSARDNQDLLASQMPSFLEYLNGLPSVADLFCHAEPGAMPVLYSDEGRTIEKDVRAYVFQPRNPENRFSQVEPNAML